MASVLRAYRTQGLFPKFPRRGLNAELLPQPHGFEGWGLAVGRTDSAAAGICARAKSTRRVSPASARSRSRPSSLSS